MTPGSRDHESLGLVDDSTPISSLIAAETRWTGRLPSQFPDEDNPVARVRHELTLWASPRMQEVREIIAQAAPIDVTVLITGETGTGKELVARAVHHLGTRRNGPFVKVNCAAVARELLESELFGHERGAFTGAHQLKIGKFEAANQGTIFLDEIGDLHPALQGKLLHVLEDGQYSRVGGRSNIKVDVRVLAATNQNLERAVAAGQFREDLFYRLNVVRIVVPPLRERREEIPLLARYFVDRYARLFQRQGFAVPFETMQRFVRHSFPGNVRELENTIKRMIVMGDPDLKKGPRLEAAMNGDDTRPATETRTRAVSLKDISRQAAQAAERHAMLQALEETQWNRLRAAKLLNVSYRSLLYKLKDAGLDRKHRASNHP
jgi:two-component system, NtrC family, response regulator AtoC